MKKKEFKELLISIDQARDIDMLKWINSLSLCPHCYCMTYTIKGKCGKCKEKKVERVLVLNSSYEFLGITDWKSAICAVYTNKATVEENYERTVSSPSVTMNVPAVIRLRKYVKVLYERITYVSYTKNNIHRRDDYICQYCGEKTRKDKITVDHVIPESRGGQSIWDNTVSACNGCNAEKDNRTPQEADMHLIRIPRKPHGFKEIIRIKIGEIHDLWEKYL
jgi:5-methylcytosine-specific restriction endonuclease McrA